MNKRGVSVLISTILLILIIISLFSAVVYFVKRSSEKTMEKGSESLEKMMNCDNINFEVEDTCYDQNYDYIDGNGIRIGIKIKNNNNFELNNFRLKLSSGETNVFAPNPPIIEPYNIGIVYGGSNEWKQDITWVKLYPIINGETCESEEYKIEIMGVKACPL